MHVAAAAVRLECTTMHQANSYSSGCGISLACCWLPECTVTTRSLLWKVAADTLCFCGMSQHVNNVSFAMRRSCKQPQAVKQISAFITSPPADGVTEYVRGELQHAVATGSWAVTTKTLEAIMASD